MATYWREVVSEWVQDIQGNNVAKCQRDYSGQGEAWSDVTGSRNIPPSPNLVIILGQGLTETQANAIDTEYGVLVLGGDVE